MDENLYSRDLGTHLVDVPGFEPSMDRTVPAPQDKLCLVQLFLGISPELLVRVPKRHLVEWDPELCASVAAKMLIWEKEHLVELFQINVEQRDRVRRRAHDAFVPAAESFDRRRRIHVCDRGDTLF